MENKYAAEPIFYFTHPNSGRIVSPTDLAAIHTLARPYCASLWSRYVSARAYHLMMMDIRDWPNFPKGERRDLGPTNQSQDEDDKVAEILAQQVSFAPADTIYFFWSKSTGIETTWEIFLRYWPRFFFDDEGPILIVPNHLTAIVFCLGSYRVAQRLPDPLEQPTFDDLVHDLEHEDWRMRQNAARTLGEHGNKNALPILIDHLSDSEFGVRQVIAESIAQLDGERAIELFTPYLHTEDIKQRRIAIQALITVGNEQALAILKADSGPDVLRAIGKKLGPKN